MTKYALLIIDMQEAYFNNRALEARKSELIRSANELIGWAQTADIPVFSIVTLHNPDRSTWTLNMLEDGEGYLFEGDRDAMIVGGLQVRATTGLVKTRDSAFFETDLANRLRGLGVDSLVLAGVSTHGCIFQTAADAYAENFHATIALEAVATHDPNFHEMTLSLLAQEYRQPALDNRGLRKVFAQ